MVNKINKNNKIKNNKVSINDLDNFDDESVADLYYKLWDDQDNMVTQTNTEQLEFDNSDPATIKSNYESDIECIDFNDNGSKSHKSIVIAVECANGHSNTGSIGKAMRKVKDELNLRSI